MFYPSDNVKGTLTDPVSGKTFKGIKINHGNAHQLTIYINVNQSTEFLDVFSSMIKHKQQHVFHLEVTTTEKAASSSIGTTVNRSTPVINGYYVVKKFQCNSTKANNWVFKVVMDYIDNNLQIVKKIGQARDVRLKERYKGNS